MRIREHVKKVSLELGGNAPFHRVRDADLDAGRRGRDGVQVPQHRQNLVCANRIFVQDESTTIPTKLGESRRDEGRQRAGAGVVQGPLMRPKSVEKVEEHIADALAKVARLVTGGKRHERDGQFLQPRARQCSPLD